MPSRIILHVQDSILPELDEETLNFFSFSVKPLGLKGSTLTTVFDICGKLQDWISKCSTHIKTT